MYYDTASSLAITVLKEQTPVIEFNY